MSTPMNEEKSYSSKMRKGGMEWREEVERLK
jgi:hypothetical protein